MINKADSFTEPQFPLSSEEIRLLAELGFAAINAGYVVPALGIFHNLRVLRPEHAFSYIGIALSHMAIGSLDEAVACLSEADLVVTIERDDLQLYRGLASALSGNVVAADRILLELSRENGLDDKQRFFLSTLLQKKHLLAGATRWPTPAKISLNQAQLAEPKNKEGSVNAGAVSEANPQSSSLTPAASSLPGW
jgi:tetratricopeptide (TPR) repeat protein